MTRKESSMQPAADPTVAVRTKFLGPIPLGSIEESAALNPRTQFEDMAGLEASIRETGVLNPILVVGTKVAGKYQLVAGARRLRASKSAGLDVIPAIELDCEAHQREAIRLIENVQRQGLSPIEEARAIAKLMERIIRPADVAAILGRTPAYCSRRLELLGLPPEAQAALGTGDLSLSVAQVLAGIPTDTDREKAWKAMLESREARLCLKDAAAARDVIQESVLPDLDQAGFDLADGELNTKAGACTNCPRRTTAQADLFGAAKGNGSCLEPACFTLKRRANFARVEAQAKEQGIKVLNKNDSKAAFHYGEQINHQQFYREDEKTYISGIGNDVKITALMKGQEDKRVLIQGPGGKAVFAYPAKAIEAAAKSRQGKKSAAASAALTDKEKAKRAKEKLEEEIEKFSDRAVHVEVLAKAAETDADKLLLWLFEHQCREAVSRGDAFKDGPYDAWTPVGQYLEGQGAKTMGELLGRKTRERVAAEFITHLVLGDVDEVQHWGGKDTEVLFKALKVNLEATRTRARSAFLLEREKKLEAKHAGKAPAAGKPKAKKAKR